MRRRQFTFSAGFLALVAIVAVVVALSSASNSKSHPSLASGSALALKETAAGRTLVDANGRTLYLFGADKRNVSTLSSAGQAVWPPYSATTVPRAASGVAASQINTITGPGGIRQIAYNGHPLYYYVGDNKPGQINGQGLNQFGARWYVLSPSGTAVTGTARPSAPSTSSNSYSYGY